MKTLSIVIAVLVLGFTASSAIEAAPAGTQVIALDSISHSPTSPLPGQDLMFSCWVLDATEATLFYRNDSVGGFSSIGMIPTDTKAPPRGPSFMVPLSGTAYQDGDYLEYYVSVTDGVDTVTDPADAPVSIHRADYVFADEALGIYFDEILDPEKTPFSPTAYQTDRPDERVTGSLAIRNPHIWEPDKGVPLAEAWVCQVRVVGDLTDVVWTISNGLVNIAGAPTVVDSTVTYPFNVGDFVVKSEPAGALNTLTLATFSCRVPTSGTQIEFFIEPWDDPSNPHPDSPAYSPDEVVWRPLGTSSGFDPDDPGTDFGSACAVINLAQPVPDSDMHWGDVKLIYR